MRKCIFTPKPSGITGPGKLLEIGVGVDDGTGVIVGVDD
jgi:hypothetical protein